MTWVQSLFWGQNNQLWKILNIKVFSINVLEWTLPAPLLYPFGLYCFPVLQITATGKPVPQDFFQKVALLAAGVGQKCEEINNHPEQNLTTAWWKRYINIPALSTNKWDIFELRVVYFFLDFFL